MPHFNLYVEIGEKYGPFDVAMLPIWRGGTLSFIARIGLRVSSHIQIRSSNNNHSDTLNSNHVPMQIPIKKLACR